MTPFEVFARGVKADGTQANDEKVIGYACAGCLLFYSPSVYACGWDAALDAAKRAAESCCDQRCDLCGADIKRGRTRCQPCLVEADRVLRCAHEQKCFSEATKIQESEHDGPVWHGTYGPQDGFFADADDLRDWCEENERELPEYVFACSRVDLRVDAHDIVDAEIESHNHHEGALDECDIDGLQELLDDWCLEQQVVSYTRDESRVVVLDCAERKDSNDDDK